jgi:hypothetical protein
MWHSRVKDYVREIVGQDMDFNVTDEVRKANENFRVPETVDL